jgi:hypothetical protein
MSGMRKTRITVCSTNACGSDFGGIRERKVPSPKLAAKSLSFSLTSSKDSLRSWRNFLRKPLTCFAPFGLKVRKMGQKGRISLLAGSLPVPHLEARL